MHTGPIQLVAWRRKLGMTDLAMEDTSLAGIVAFYSIVHFAPAELTALFQEMHRVLQPDGLALISLHVGDRVLRVDDLFGATVSLDFRFHEPALVTRSLGEAGLVVIEHVEREPHDGVEYPSRRCYLLARPRSL